MAPPDIKKMISIKLKPRKDPYSDQFSRIVMVKMMMLTAAITAISWTKDKFACMVPKAHGLSAGFVAKACWINGVYVYKDLDPKQTSFYYGIPEDVSFDGYNPYGIICNTESSESGSCQPMEKTFYLQYQWFPFGVAALGILYYLPYLLYCVINSDILNIKDLIKNKKTDEVDYDEIMKKFFTRKNNSHSMLTSRVLLNVVVKVFYVIANVVAMILIDMSLNGQFLPFGGNWSTWIGLSNEARNDYLEPRENPKAGSALLPGFGICEVANAAKDQIHSHTNKHVYICEVSQHILYQYILIILWYMLVFGIVISILGLIKHIFDQAATTCCLTIEGEDAQRVYPSLAIRERQYMDYIRNKNLPVFGELLQRFMKAKGMRNRSISDSSNDAAHSEKQNMMME